MNKNSRLPIVNIDNHEYAIRPVYHNGELDRKESRIYSIGKENLMEVVEDEDLIARVLDKYESEMEPENRNPVRRVA